MFRNVGTCRHLPTKRNKCRRGKTFLDCHYHPRRQVSPGFEHGVPVIPPDAPNQLADRGFGEVRAKPFKGSDDITGETIAQHQHPPGGTADLDDLLAEIERPRAAVGQVDLSDGDLRGQPQGTGRSRAMTDDGVPRDAREGLDRSGWPSRRRTCRAPRASNAHAVPSEPTAATLDRD